MKKNRFIEEARVRRWLHPYFSPHCLSLTKTHFHALRQVGSWCVDRGISCSTGPMPAPLRNSGEPWGPFEVLPVVSGLPSLPGWSSVAIAVASSGVFCGELPAIATGGDAVTVGLDEPTGVGGSVTSVANASLRCLSRRANSTSLGRTTTPRRLSNERITAS